MIANGRMTAQLDGDFVVFLIGMRINQLLAPQRWVPAAAAMPRMLRELARMGDRGLLHAESFVRWRTVLLVQYWRSFEQLHAYAHARDLEHLPAWAEFNRRARGNASVGIFHETFLVRAGEYETVYVDMPPLLMGSAGRLVPAVGRLEGARARVQAGSGDAAPPPPGGRG